MLGQPSDRAAARASVARTKYPAKSVSSVAEIRATEKPPFPGKNRAGHEEGCPPVCAGSYRAKGQS
jgi:hypothetical protein